MSLLIALLLVPAVIGYDSTFKYGCQDGQCTYQLVIPKVVAQLINESELSGEVSQISKSLDTLNQTLSNFGTGNDVDTFTELFNGNFSLVNSTAQDLNTNVNTALGNSNALLVDSAYTNATAMLLYNSISCFKNTSLSSYTCFTLPTTIAPKTTAGDVTTGNPVTGNTGASDASTAVPSAGPSVSTGAPVSTVSAGTGATADVASTSTSGSQASSTASSPSASEGPTTESAAPSTTSETLGSPPDF